MNGALLVTGGSGFIGASVLRVLQSAALARPIVLAGRNDIVSRAGGMQHLRLDLAAPAIELPHGIETVLHLAGEKRDEARMQAINHDGAVRLVEASARAGARHFVHLSSVGVYGARKHAGLVDESHAHAPRNQYEVSKDAGEHGVRARCSALGVRCVVLQPSNVVGIVPGRSYPLLGLVRMIACDRFRQFGAVDAWVNYVAVEDVAGALAAAALDADAEGVFIVNTPARLSGLADWIAEELGVPPPRARLPYWVGAAAAAAGALGRSLLRRELPFSPERLRELTNTTRYDGSAITRLLGFTYPLGIEAALRAMIAQYRRDGLV